MRFLVIPAALLLFGCASGAGRDPSTARPAPVPTASARAVVKQLRLTLDLRYKLGETLSLDTRVVLLSGDRQVTTTLADCGMTPTPEAMRFTTGGIVRPDAPCHALITPPGEATQVFVLDIPKKSKEWGVWSEWTLPASQIVSPMPAQTIIHQPQRQQKMTVPLARQFEVRHQVTEQNTAKDPKTN
ncbi:MAG: hypothetical protein R6X19_12005 [Kiritimatiellia bacterium]